jgi:hypothetical protein
MFQGQAGGKKVLKDPISMEKSWAWWYVPVIPVTAGSINRRSRWFWAKCETLSPK